MKRLLTEMEWETVLDCAEEALSGGCDWGVLREGFALAERKGGKWELLAADVEQIEPRVRARWKRRLRAESQREDFEESRHLPGGVEAEAAPRAYQTGLLAQLADAIDTILGVGVAELQVVWRRGRTHLVYEGDKVRELSGPGPEWLACAVEIVRADGSVDMFAECRVRGLNEKPMGVEKGRRLELWELTLEGKAHDTGAMLRRIAAWKLHYYGERSGMRDSVELAALNGTSKQAVHKQLKRIRRTHEERTGESADRLPGVVRERGRRKNDETRIPKSESPTSNAKAQAVPTITSTSQ